MPVDPKAMNELLAPPLTAETAPKLAQAFYDAAFAFFPSLANTKPDVLEEIKAQITHAMTTLMVGTHFILPHISPQSRHFLMQQYIQYYCTCCYRPLQPLDEYPEPVCICNNKKEH